MWCIKYHQIYKRLLRLPPRHEPHGRILLHSRAMSGFAGLSLPRNKILGAIGLKGRVRSLWKECVDLVVGLGVLIESE